MKSRLEKVYSKLPNQKVDLKTQKVELSLIDNLENEIIQLYNMAEKADSNIKNAKEIIEKVKDEAFDFVVIDFQSAFTKLENSLDEANNKMEEIGLDKSLLKTYYDDKYDIKRIFDDLMSEIETL